MEELALTICPDDAAWDRFVGLSPQGSVFSRAALLRALGEPLELWFLEERGLPQVAIPLLVRDGVPTRAPFPFLLYQGPMFGAASYQEPVHRGIPHRLKLIEFLIPALSQRYPRLSFAFHHAVDDLRGWQWFNYHTPGAGQFQLQLRYTGLLELTDLVSREALASSFRTVRRQEAKRAEASGCRIESTSDLELIDRMHEATFSRQGLERSPEEACLLRSIASAALSGEFGLAWVARLSSGEPASSVLFLHDERGGYYFLAANDPEHRKSGASSLLMLHALDHFRAAGRKFIDFVGLNSPNRGDFKTSFGCRPVPHFLAQWEKPATV